MGKQLWFGLGGCGRSVKGPFDLLDNSEHTKAEFATASDIDKDRADPLVGISEVEYSTAKSQFGKINNLESVSADRRYGLSM